MTFYVVFSKSGSKSVHSLAKPFDVRTTFLLDVLVYSFDNFRIHPTRRIEPVHEISNNVVCVTSRASDQPAQSDQSLC